MMGIGLCTYASSIVKALPAVMTQVGTLLFVRACHMHIQRRLRGNTEGGSFCTGLLRNMLRLGMARLQVAVATNPTHYGNPSTGCESDEVAVRVSGLSGDFCSPKCDSQGTCPSDVPKGDTATPQCALRTTTGDKYCGLICQADSDCGAIPALVTG